VTADRRRLDAAADPMAVLRALGARVSPDLDAYAAGELDASQVRCALCGAAPCQCPPFGTPAYFEMIDRAHGRGPRCGVCHARGHWSDQCESSRPTPEGDSDD
jgi:hypothetical protein